MAFLLWDSLRACNKNKRMLVTEVKGSHKHMGCALTNISNRQSLNQITQLSQHRDTTAMGKET